MSEHTLVDIQPTPNVLLALTRTPIAPLDALCELIDNAIDSFKAAELEGITVPYRQVFLDVPSQSEVARGEGVLRIRDSGLGLTENQVADALRAGYSSKNAFDTLGLFGMGFNIATGKLGRITKLISARSADDYAMEVVVDLPRLIEQGTFEVPAMRIPKPQALEHGTIVEVKGWWPEGDPNNAFIRKLASMAKPVVRRELARRYATLLRGDDGPKVRLTVNGESEEAFEHCVWDASRAVDRQGYGQIPARIEFDQQLSSSSRCVRDGTLMGIAATCPRCGGADTRVVPERIWGWVGIQRYDDQNEFGIDLIRNGRAIRVAEKAAFFEYVDEDTKRTEKEYPIDQQYGRIVGEVHLDHVPVDFSKQDFQRTSNEWHDAMDFLRGGSLLPSNWEPGSRNTAPVSLLFQGYRKVRNFGASDMYMGVYNPARKRAERISREIEKEFLGRFEQREAGYYDDARWWDLVESATEGPIDDLPECQHCGFQNLPTAETCEGCDRILRGKTCVDEACNVEIPVSALKCPHCGASQVPEIISPWSCAFCQSVNDGEEVMCHECGLTRGTPHPADQQALERDSAHQDELSIAGLEVRLVKGKSSPVDVTVRTMLRPLTSRYQGPTVPVLSKRLLRAITVYVDPKHVAFADLGMRIEDVVAIEVAQFIYDSSGTLIGSPGHSVGSIAAEVLRSAWPERVADAPEQVRSEIELLFASIVERVVQLPEAVDFYSELSLDEQKRLAEGMLSSGVDLGRFSEMISSGEYLRFAEPAVLPALYEAAPEVWFGGRVWDELWPPDEIGVAVAESLRQELKEKYLRCLQDCVSYLKYRTPERLLVVRARAALEFLSAKLQ